MKKVLAAALLCAVSSFAAWDKFPIKDAGKGEAKIGVAYGMPAEKVSELDINFKARFSVIEGLEVAAMLEPGFRVMSDHDGNDGATGLLQPVLGVRYWLPMGLGVFVDVGLPVAGEDFEYEKDYLTFTPGVQYSTKINEQLSIGAQVGLLIHMAQEVDMGLAKVDVNPGMFLGFGFEVDYSLGSITPFVGIDFKTQLTKAQVDGNDVGETNGLGFDPYVGSIFEINEMLAADVFVSLGFGEDWVGKNADGDNNLPITIGANLSINF